MGEVVDLAAFRKAKYSAPPVELCPAELDRRPRLDEKKERSLLSRLSAPFRGSDDNWMLDEREI